MTGQYPKRRETDVQAKERVAALEQARRDYLAGAYRIPGHVVEARKPRITSSGRLIDPWA